MRHQTQVDHKVADMLIARTACTNRVKELTKIMEDSQRQIYRDKAADPAALQHKINQAREERLILKERIEWLSKRIRLGNLNL